MKRRARVRLGTAALAALILTFAAPLAASAHVTVAPEQAQAGSWVKLTFSVPTESATASTVGLEITLPTTHPFTSVSYQPVTGWSARVTTTKLATPVKSDDGTITTAPTAITWTANPDAQIEPGQFQQFTISAGIVPDAGRISFPTRQSYSDGSVVAWDQSTPDSGKEPAHPAPTLYINDAPPGESASDAPGVTSSPVAGEPNAAVSDRATDTSSTVAIALGLAGLALGAAALVISVYALTRHGRGADTSAFRDGR